MPKPIFIVKVPTNDPSLNVEAVQRINNNLVEMMSDYHVLFIGDNRKRGGLKYECFNTSDLQTVDFDYLKWYVKSNLLTRK